MFIMTDLFFYPPMLIKKAVHLAEVMDSLYQPSSFPSPVQIPVSREGAKNKKSDA